MKHAGKAHAARWRINQPMSTPLPGKLDNKMVAAKRD